MKAFLLAALLTACTVGTSDNFENPEPSPPATCTTSDAVLGCGAGATGYTCTSDRPDDGDTRLVCSAGAPGQGVIQYCCLPFGQSFSECTVGAAGCADPGFGFSCTGAVGPADVDVRLACSAARSSGREAGGASSYCCLPSDVVPTCAPAPTATCPGAAVAYACVAGASPGAGSAVMTCDEGSQTEGGLLHCCVPFHQSASGCLETHGVCAAGSFGFTCEGGVTPETVNSALSCTGGPTYCCTLP